MKRAQGRTIVLAGGGTAGHVEPALAIARAWLRKYPDDACVFLGTPDGLENVLVPAAGFELRRIPKVAMPRSIGKDLIHLPVRLVQAVLSARRHIRGADVLIGFGGYLSASAYLAASSLRIPIVIHEANSTVGWANRLGAKFTKCLACAHPIAVGNFAHARVTGMPLRQDVRNALLAIGEDWQIARKNAKAKLGWDPEKPSLLIIGGSQGSTFINSQIEAAMPALADKHIQILHSVGSKNALPESATFYKPVAYIDDMASAYLAADLVIARSGAVTCAEFGALGRMALFIPLPIGNGEQARNADHLVAAGRAVVLPQDQFNSNWLLANIDHLFSRSALNASAGLSSDLNAEDRIIELMESSIDGRCI